VRDTEEGLSEFPHVIVNQARMLAYLLEHMERSPSKLVPHYGLRLDAVDVGTDGVSATLCGVQDRGDVDGPCQVRRRLRRRTQRRAHGDRPRARRRRDERVLGRDGRPRRHRLPGHPVKAAINSAEGNILIIPREGGYLVRFYIELDTAGVDTRSVTPEHMAQVANRILHPHTLELKDVGWWSVYSIGQRLCERFDDVPADETAVRPPRVFIAGDACHTHSAKPARA
jgi:phenol 2-monooxygenase